VKPSTERDGSLNGLKNFQENYCDSFNFVDLRSCVSKRGSTLLLTSFFPNSVLTHEYSVSVTKHLKQVFSPYRVFQKSVKLFAIFSLRFRLFA